MNKLSSNQENPLDLAIYRVTSSLLPFFHDTGHTPNIITTYSFLCGLMSLACLCIVYACHGVACVCVGDTPNGVLCRAVHCQLHL